METSREFAMQNLPLSTAVVVSTFVWLAGFGFSWIPFFYARRLRVALHLQVVSCCSARSASKRGGALARQIMRVSNSSSARIDIEGKNILLGGC